MLELDDVMDIRGETVWEIASVDCKRVGDVNYLSVVDEYNSVLSVS